MLQIDPQENLKFFLSKLEGFVTSETCSVSMNDIGVIQYIILSDKRNRKLHLCVKTELIGHSSLKVCCEHC